MMDRNAALLAVVALALVPASAGAAIYDTYRDYDETQTLFFLEDCTQPTSIEYLTLPDDAHNVKVVRPRVGDPLGAMPPDPPDGHVASIMRDGSLIAVRAQVDPPACPESYFLWGGLIANTRIEFTRHARQDGRCTFAGENLARRGGFVGNVVATNIRCYAAIQFVADFRYHGASLGATFRYRGYRCHISGHPEAATIRCTKSRHRAVRWNVGD